MSLEIILLRSEGKLGIVPGSLKEMSEFLSCADKKFTVHFPNLLCMVSPSRQVHLSLQSYHTAPAISFAYIYSLTHTRKYKGIKALDNSVLDSVQIPVDVQHTVRQK